MSLGRYLRFCASLPWRSAHGQDGWRSFEVTTRVDIQRPSGVSRAWIPLPLLLALGRLYPWAVPEIVAEDPVLQFKQPYLNVPFFIVRAVVYFAFWMACVWLLNTWSAAQDRAEAAIDPAGVVRIERNGATVIGYRGKPYPHSISRAISSSSTIIFRSYSAARSIAGSVAQRTVFAVIPAKAGIQMSGWVYILASRRNGTLYTGVTANLPAHLIDQ